MERLRDFDPKTALAQIGTGNVLAVSGGRVYWNDEYQVLTLPVSSGYKVEVQLDWMDTYTVSRVWETKSKRVVKGVQHNVYFDELGETVYQAGMYKSNEFGS